MSVRDLPFFPTVNTSGGTQNDGVSPTITVSEITGGHRLTIVDAAGTKSIDIMNGTNANLVQPDHAQNDPTQPDYIKNRLAYYDRKFEDMEPTEYPEPAVGGIKLEYEEEVDGEMVMVSYFEPLFMKFAELPENTSPKEFIEEVIGFYYSYWDEKDREQYEEIIRFDDPEMFPPEYMEYLIRQELFDENGQSIGAMIMFTDQPYALVLTVDDILYNWVISYEHDGEVYEEVYPIYIPEKGIYTVLMDYDEDDNGNYTNLETVNKIFFKGAKTIDKELLPPEALSKSVEVSDYINQNDYNPVSANAVYWALQNKLDRPYTGGASDGYVLTWRTSTSNDGYFTLAAVPSNVSQYDFDRLKTDYETYKLSIGNSMTHANDVYSKLEPALAIMNQPSSVNKVLVITFDGKISLTDRIDPILNSRINTTYEFLQHVISQNTSENNGKLLGIVEGKLTYVDGGVPVTSEDDGKIMVVKEGKWQAVNIPFAEEEVY